MKSAKLLIFATLLVFTSVSIANADGFTAKKVVNISFEKAMGSPGLVAAMHQQLNLNFMGSNQQDPPLYQVYVLSVEFQGIIYKISGTYEQWKMLLTPKWKIGSESKRGVIIQN